MKNVLVEYTCDRCGEQTSIDFLDDKPEKDFEKEGWCLSKNDEIEDWCPKCHKEMLKRKDDES